VPLWPFPSDPGAIDVPEKAQQAIFEGPERA
jgi:hypothetical protein